MCCYNTLGDAWALSASSKEFSQLKILIKYRLQGKKKTNPENLRIAEVLEESTFDGLANGNTL